MLKLDAKKDADNKAEVYSAAIRQHAVQYDRNGMNFVFTKAANIIGERIEASKTTDEQKAYAAARSRVNNTFFACSQMLEGIQ